MYCFDLTQMAVILDFTHNTMTKVRSGHTPMSDMLGKKYMILLLFCQKYYQFIVLLCTNGGYLGLYSQFTV